MRQVRDTFVIVEVADHKQVRLLRSAISQILVHKPLIFRVVLTSESRRPPHGGRVRAVVIGEGGTLGLAERPMPVPGDTELLIAVRAARCGSRADLAQRRGEYPSPPGWPANIPGLRAGRRGRARGGPRDALLRRATG